jgi:hypothetical protein
VEKIFIITVKMKFKWLLLLIAITHKCPRLKTAELFEDQ